MYSAKGSLSTRQQTGSNTGPEASLSDSRPRPLGCLDQAAFMSYNSENDFLFEYKNRTTFSIDCDKIENHNIVSIINIWL